jgi:hypothetical protein
VETILASKPHPEAGYRSCLGVIRLGKTYSLQRLEAAAGRALHLRACSYPSIKSILACGLDRQPLPEPAPSRRPIQHPNIRGAEYFDSSSPSLS